MEIRTFTAPGFAENAYLIWRKGGSAALAIDPGAAVQSMIDMVHTEGLELSAILLTHAHVDHIEGVARLASATGAPIYLHPEDQIFYTNAPLQAAQFGMHVDAPPPPDMKLVDGEVLRLADLELEVRHVPGHSPGHVLFYVAAAAAAFVGDVVFQGSIGRTDLPGGNYQQLMRSIRERVMTLPERTTLYSGHGPPTTVIEERTHNPFIAPSYGGSFA